MDVFEFGELVRDERKSRNLTQEELADKSGVTRSRLNRIENGRVFDMNLSTALALLEAMDLDFRVTNANSGRPTFEDVQREQDDTDFSM